MCASASRRRSEVSGASSRVTELDFTTITFSFSLHFSSHRVSFSSPRLPSAPPCPDPAPASRPHPARSRSAPTPAPSSSRRAARSRRQPRARRLSALPVAERRLARLDGGSEPLPRRQPAAGASSAAGCGAAILGADGGPSRAPPPPPPTRASPSVADHRRRGASTTPADERRGVAGRASGVPRLAEDRHSAVVRRSRRSPDVVGVERAVERRVADVEVHDKVARWAPAAASAGQRDFECRTPVEERSRSTRIVVSTSIST